VSRYRGRVKRLYFRGDAVFANPEVYEFFEAEGMSYTIRLPTNRVLQDKIGHLLWADVQRNPYAHWPVTGATRTSVKGPESNGRSRMAEARLDEWRTSGLQRPRARQLIAWAAHGTPSRGDCCHGCALQQTIALADTGIVECRLNPRSPTLRIRGCTYCPGAPVGRLSGECPIKGRPTVI
jgi:hypothetical protein